MMFLHTVMEISGKNYFFYDAVISDIRPGARCQHDFCAVCEHCVLVVVASAFFFLI